MTALEETPGKSEDKRAMFGRVLSKLWTEEEAERQLADALKSEAMVTVDCQKCGKKRAWTLLPDWDKRQKFLEFFVSYGLGKPATQAVAPKPVDTSKSMSEMSDEELLALIAGAG